MDKSWKSFLVLRTKTCSYLKNNNNEDKKAKGTKKCVIKRKRKFQDYKNCSEAAQIENKIIQIDPDSLKEDQKELIKKQ